MTKLVPLFKYHGLGNDWLMLLERHVPSDVPGFARKILDRHTGVGADGLIVFMKSKAKGHDAHIHFFNADGSEAEMSGNGIRCAGAFLVRENRRLRTLRVETASGVKTLELLSTAAQMKKGKWSFRVNMGRPILDAGNIPFVAGKHPSPVIGYPIRTTHGILAATITSMGNPHCSIFVENFSSIPWEDVGREIERSTL